MTEKELMEKWFNKGIEAGEIDGWMALEDTLEETLRDYGLDIHSVEDLVTYDMQLWDETEHFWRFYGKEMWEDAKSVFDDEAAVDDLYMDLKIEFWEGYLQGRKNIGIDIYGIAEGLLKQRR
jgi:hypothetical protein